jgi:hypothetical protein
MDNTKIQRHRIHKPKEFFFYCGRANSPVKLERPENARVMTDELFKQMIAMQPILREQHLQNIKEVGITKLKKLKNI